MSTSLKTKLIDTIAVSNTLGEGIQWHAERGEIWWTDVIGKKLYSYNWDQKIISSYTAPEEICSFAFINDTHSKDVQLLVAFATGLAFYTPSTSETVWIHPKICDNVNLRLNDGRVDRQGRFWVGSMSKLGNEYVEAKGNGQLYCLDANQKLSIHEDNIHISNGTCWSPDSNHMYFSDSPRREIYRYRFNSKTGQNTKREIFQKTPHGAYPDGACVDADGFIWSAHWGAGKVVRYNPKGQIDAEVDIPVSQPSCVAFGGKDLNLLCVTTARQDLNEQQLEKETQAGNVFIFETNIQGLPESQYG